jgi:hypothetical protein
MKKQGIVIPHEHGGWAMVSVPFLLGMMAGTPQWIHLPLFFAWLFFYLASYPLLQSMKRSAQRGRLMIWGMLYGGIAFFCLIPSLFNKPSLLYFGPLLLLLLTINIWYATRKSERAILNDLCAILVFSVGGAAAYLSGGGDWDETMALVIAFSFLHFAGSAFFVKSLFRERNNKRWIAYARAYHVGLLAAPWAIGFPLMTVAYVLSAVRAFVFAGKTMRPMKAGMIEIASTLQFVLISIYLFRFEW